MNILYLGDIMGQPGREVVKSLLPNLRQKLKVDLVIAQSENVSHGRGITPTHVRELQRVGVDFFSGGNHSIERAATKALLENPKEPVIAPMNQIGVEVEWGVKQIETAAGQVLIASLLGSVFPNPVGLRNPLQSIDELLTRFATDKFVAVIVNFHGDLSSEKRVVGYYLDSRVSAVIGDHWHVPTADAMVLPGGTAHITDVGMCGTLHSSLGVHKEIIIARWRDGAKIKNEIADGGPYQLNGVLVAVDTKTRLATKITSINRVVEKLG